MVCWKPRIQSISARDTRLASTTGRDGARAATTTPATTSALSATARWAARGRRDLANPHRTGGAAAMAAAAGIER